MSRTMVDIESNKTCISIGSPTESPILIISSCVITFIPLYNAPSSVEKFTWPENRSESLSWHLFVSFFAMDGKEFVTSIGFQRFIKTDKIYSTDWFQKPPLSLPLIFYLYGLCKTNTARKIGFKQICNWSKHDANLGLQIWPKFAMKAMMMQIQIFIPVVFARKCEVNMISTLPLLCFWYLRKSTNLTYIYTDLLYLQSIKFAYSTKCRQIWCKSICLHHCFTNVVEASNKNICTCFTHVLLQEQICSLH